MHIFLTTMGKPKKKKKITTVLALFQIVNFIFLVLWTKDKTTYNKIILYYLTAYDDLPHSGTVRGIDTFVIVGAGGLGSNIQQLSNAIYYCESLGCKNIVVPQSFWFVPDHILYRKFGITIERSPYEDTQRLCNKSTHGTFCSRQSIKRGVPMLVPKNRHSAFKKDFLSIIPKVAVDDDGLYIHIRGGSIFSGTSPDRDKGQPPLCYYESIIEKWRFPRLYIIAEDRRNPVVDVLVAKYNAVLLNGTLENAVAYITNANNLVMSKSAFAIEVLWLSDKKKNMLFSWEEPVRKYRNFYHEPTQFYSEAVTDNWKNTPEQREIMLNATCGTWWQPSFIDRLLTENKFEKD